MSVDRYASGRPRTQLIKGREKGGLRGALAFNHNHNDMLITLTWAPHL
jgi:hypothetical protein